MLNFFKLFEKRPIRDYEQKEHERYSWQQGQLGHMYISNKNRKVLYRIFKDDDNEVYKLEILNSAPKIIGTFLDLESAKDFAERHWVDINTWIS